VCAMSRAELLLLGSPSGDLGEVIDESMTLVPALGTEPEAAGGRREGNRHRAGRIRFWPGIGRRLLGDEVRLGPELREGVRKGQEVIQI